MRGTGAARTGQPIAIDDEDAVGDRIEPVELFQKVAMMEPADAAFIPVEQARTVEQEGTGTDTDQRYPQRRRAAQISGIFAAEPVDFVDQAADHDDIVEAGGIAEVFIGLDGDPGAGRDRRGTVGYYLPIAGDVPAAIAFVRREAQDVDEIGEGAKREAPGENEAHRQTQARRPTAQGRVQYRLRHAPTRPQFERSCTPCRRVCGGLTQLSFPGPQSLSQTY